MGSWGTEILQNDIALDTWEEYLDLFEKGFSKEEIQDLMVASNRDGENFYLYDNAFFWLALAKTQLDMGVVDSLILKIIKKINEEEIDLHDYWNRKPAFLEQRKKHQLELQKEMEEFLAVEKEEASAIIDNVNDLEELKGYFEHYYTHQLGKKEELEGKIIKEENERWKQNLHYQLFQLHLENLIAAFSSGKSSVELKNVVKSLEEYKAYSSAIAIDFERKKQYVQSLWLLSFMILLEVEEPEAKKVLKLIGNDGRDFVYEFLAMEFEKRSLVDCLILHRKPYNHLAEIIDLYTEEEQLEVINTFLPKWYNGMSDTWFFEAHRKGDYSFFGYWSFEVAALVKILGLPLKNRNKLPNYPVFSI